MIATAKLVKGPTTDISASVFGSDGSTSNGETPPNKNNVMLETGNPF